MKVKCGACGEVVDCQFDDQMNICHDPCEVCMSLVEKESYEKGREVNDPTRRSGRT